MEFIVLIIVFLGGISYLAVRRGRTTVRAALYLCCMEDGISVEDANNACKGTDYLDAAKMQSRFIRYSSAPFGGSQLKMIAAARRKGFEG